MTRDGLVTLVGIMEEFLGELRSEEPGSEEYNNTLDSLTASLPRLRQWESTEQLAPEIAQAVKIIDTRMERLAARERREGGVLPDDALHQEAAGSLRSGNADEAGLVQGQARGAGGRQDQCRRMNRWYTPARSQSKMSYINSAMIWSGY